jgi:hypothetical protein
MKTLALLLALTTVTLAQDTRRPPPVSGDLPDPLLFEYRPIRPIRPQDLVTSFYANEKIVFSFRGDGSVEFGEGFTANDAAKEFWKYMGNMMPGKCER